MSETVSRVDPPVPDATAVALRLGGSELLCRLLATPPVPAGHAPGFAVGLLSVLARDVAPAPVRRAAEPRRTTLVPAA